MKRISKQVILYHCTNVFWKLQENTWEKARKTRCSKAICLGNVYKKYVLQIKPKTKVCMENQMTVILIETQVQQIYCTILDI